MSNDLFVTGLQKPHTKYTTDALKPYEADKNDQNNLLDENGLMPSVFDSDDFQVDGKAVKQANPDSNTKKFLYDADGDGKVDREVTYILDQETQTFIKDSELINVGSLEVQDGLNTDINGDGIAKDQVVLKFDKNGELIEGIEVTNGYASKSNDSQEIVGDQRYRYQAPNLTIEDIEEETVPETTAPEETVPEETAPEEEDEVTSVRDAWSNVFSQAWDNTVEGWKNNVKGWVDFFKGVFG